MRRTRFTLATVVLVLLAGLLLGTRPPAQAQMVIGTVSLADGADVVAVNPVTNRVYVGRPAGVVTMDGTTDAILATITTYAYQLALNPMTGRIYVSGLSTYGHPGDLTVVDAGSNTVVASFPTTGGPAALAVNPVTNRIYVGCGACSEVSVLDGTSNRVIGTVPGVGRLAANPATNRLYTLGVGNGVAVIDGATNAIVTTIPVGKDLRGIAVNPTTNRVYVLNAENNTIAVIDGASDTVSATIPVGTIPSAVAVNPTTNHIFVARSADGTVTALDGATNAVLDTVRVGAMPMDVAVNPTTNRVYVANQGSNSVSVLEDVTSSVPHDARYFPQTGFRVDNDAIWDYFVHRGGVSNIGYPVSRAFRFESHTVQFFQRRIVELDDNGHPRLLNLLDAGLMPYNTFNQAQMPAFDSTLVGTAPPVTDARATLAFVQAHAPDTFQGMPVDFYRTFVNTVTAAVAFPNGGDPNLLPGFNLELWGIPTSATTFDPNNHNFVYLRFQRGIMMYDASCTCTQGILLADYLKGILTGQNLPSDLNLEAQSSLFYKQYDPSQPNWVHDSSRLPNTDLTNAFSPE